jgi:hypothetical protein
MRKPLWSSWDSERTGHLSRSLMSQQLQPAAVWHPRHYQAGEGAIEERRPGVMAIRSEAKGEVIFPAPKGLTFNHPWTRPCMVEGCQGEHTSMACCIFKAKSPEDRLAAVRAVHLLLSPLGYEMLLVRWEDTCLWGKRIWSSPQPPAA